jgi:recombination protein RecA
MARGDLKDVAEQVRSTSKKPVKKEKDYARATIPTGLTTLNLALDDNPHYGYRRGSVVNIIGDTHTGKTTLAMLCFAACAHDKDLKDHHLIYDSAEPLIGLDIEKLYGKRTRRRVKPMHPDKDPKYSRTVEDFMFGLMNLLDRDEPFVLVLDSLDALTSEDDLEHVEAKRKAWEKGKDTSGSYGMAKAKNMSIMFRNIADRIEQTDSLVIVISQTRDNINPMSFKKKTRSGGKALDFYAHIIMWLAHKGKIDKTVNKKKHVVGNKTLLKIDKNKYTGKQRRAEFDTYYDYGVDDIGSMVDWMLDNGVWDKKKGGAIDAEGVDLSGKRDELVQQIEKNDLEDGLKVLVATAWQGIEDSLRLGRKSRF